MRTIGELLRQMVFTLPEESVEVREPPYLLLENMAIGRDLFGWKLYYTKSGRKTKEFLECRSEEEARYLKLLIDSGLRDIHVPKDDEYLKNILPELEQIKARIDEIINPTLVTIYDPAIRARLKFEVFQEVNFPGEIEEI